MNYTDENVPVECSECDSMCEGFDEILHHIIEVHGDHYTQEEAVQYARNWTDQAHDLRREELADYYDQRKIDRAIERDIDHARHKI